MITHANARTMAETLWGRGGTTALRTNRAGAFYFSCSGHGGFILDSRALSAEAARAIARYRAPSQAGEIHDPDTGRVHAFLNPHRVRGRTVRSRPAWRVRQVAVFDLEEDVNWCLAVIFAGIRTDAMSAALALETFDHWRAGSAHERAAARAAMGSHTA